MKRVLYIGGFDLPDKNAAAQRVLANAKILRGIGYSVTLVGISHKTKDRASFSFQGFECVNLPYPANFCGWYRMLISIRQYIPFIQDDTVAVIAYNHPSIALQRLLNYNRKRGIKTIADCTEWYEPRGGWLFNFIKGWDVERRMRKIHLSVDGIITISKYLDDFYKKDNVKTILLPPLVDKLDPKWCCEKQDNNDELISLLYAGSPEGEKGEKDRLDYVIDALNTIALQGNNFVFNVIGITKEQYSNLYAKDGMPNIPSFIHFWGRIPHLEVINHLSESDFQIFLREDTLTNRAGFPTKFAETISAGTIVLTNASSNLKDYMIEGVNSFELKLNSKEDLVSSLSKPLSLSKMEIKNIKSQIDKDMFDYRGYINEMKCFLESI